MAHSRAVSVVRSGRFTLLILVAISTQLTTPFSLRSHNVKLFHFTLPVFQLTRRKHTFIKLFSSTCCRSEHVLGFFFVCFKGEKTDWVKKNNKKKKRSRYLGTHAQRLERCSTTVFKFSWSKSKRLRARAALLTS